jgi:hypothetical protein
MFSLSVHDFILTLSVGLFLIGVISSGLGIFILVSRAMGEDVRVIANQTARLAQKGIAEDVAGLVGNASSLIDSLNRLVQTTMGIGSFLFVAGFLLILSAYFIIRQIM